MNQVVAKSSDSSEGKVNNDTCPRKGHLAMHSCWCVGQMWKLCGGDRNCVQHWDKARDHAMASPAMPNLGASLYHGDLGILNESHTKQEQMYCGCRGLWGGRQITWVMLMLLWGWGKGKVYPGCAGDDWEQREAFSLLAKVIQTPCLLVLWYSLVLLIVMWSKNQMVSAVVCWKKMWFAQIW